MATPVTPDPATIPVPPPARPETPNLVLPAVIILTAVLVGGLAGAGLTLATTAPETPAECLSALEHADTVLTAYDSAVDDALLAVGVLTSGGVDVVPLLESATDTMNAVHDDAQAFSDTKAACRASAP